MTPQQPFDEQPTLTDGKVIDGDIIDGEVIEDLDTQVINLDTDVVADDATARLRQLSMEIDEPPTELGEERAATLHALAAAAGEPPEDLRAGALAAARRVRRSRYLVTAVTVLALLGASGTAVATGWGNDKTDRLVTAAPGTADPAPSVLPTEVTPSTPAASVVPGADTAVGAVRGATAAPGGAARSGAGAPAAGGGTSSGGGKPAPKPGKPAAPLEITGTAVSDQAPLVGQEVFFTVNWSDGDGRYFGSGADWDEPTQPPGFAGSMDRCNEVPSPRHGSARMSHTWNNAGTYNVKLSVSTYDCKTYTLETREVTVKITVSDPPPPTDPPPSSPPPSSPPPASPSAQG